MTGGMTSHILQFPADPSKIAVLADLEVLVDQQICAGGQWVGGNGVQVDGNAGIGCVEKPHPRRATFETEYSPGNGGSNVKVVYLKLAFQEPQPEGCHAPHVRLSLP